MSDWGSNKELDGNPEKPKREQVQSNECFELGIAGLVDITHTAYVHSAYPVDQK
jgi:hypothetical protein